MRARGKFLVGATALGLMVAGACAEPDEPDASDHEGWIDTMPNEPPGSNPALGGDGDGDEEGDEEGDEDGDDEDFAAWAIFGQYSDGSFTELEGEFFAEQGETVLCSFLFEVSVAQTLDDCDSCSAAWEFEFGAPAIEEESDGACDEVGIDEVNGSLVRLGFSGETLYRDQGDGWEEIGGEAWEEEGELVLEWEPE